MCCTVYSTYRDAFRLCVPAIWICMERIVNAFLRGQIIDLINGQLLPWHVCMLYKLHTKDERTHTQHTHTTGEIV